MTVQTAIPVSLGFRSSGAIRAFGLCVIEARPAVQGIFLARFAAGALLAHHLTDGHPFRVAAGAAAWWCATVFVYLINGVTDVTEDRANGSRRPVAGGRLPVQTARTTCAVLAAAALLLAACVNPLMTVLVVLFLGLGYAYSAEPFALKNRSLGSTAVGVLGCLATYAAGYDVIGGQSSSRLVVFSAALSCWMGLVGLQSKDLSDVEGDKKAARPSPHAAPTAPPAGSSFSTPSAWP
jgi:4-hydroxybenzoate polyprenyltransferase